MKQRLWQQITWWLILNSGEIIMGTTLLLVLAAIIGYCTLGHSRH